MLFISHCTADDPFVDQLAAELQIHGFRTWVDHHDMPPGTKWVRQLQTALEASSAMLLILSTNSLASPYVEAEWHAFFEMKRPIFPLRIDDCDMPLFLRGFHQLDFRHADNFSKPFNNLLNVIDHGFENGDKLRDTDLVAARTHTTLLDEPTRSADFRQQALNMLKHYPHRIGVGEVIFALPQHGDVIHKVLLSTMTIGRHHAASNAYPDIDLQPYEFSLRVSRLHATLNLTRNGLLITDMHSKNGTYIEDVLLKPNAPYSLANDSVVFLSAEFPVFVRYRYN